MTPDARRIIAAQAARALAYGLGSVLIGVTLARRGLSGSQVGFVLAGLLAGIALASVLPARYGDRIGRRRCYRLLFLGLAAAGTVFALTSWLFALVLAALSGTVSTDVVESGPFTSLEQAMLPLDRSRPIVLRLSALFALDSLGGCFVPQTFIASVRTQVRSVAADARGRVLRDRCPAGGVVPGGGLACGSVRVAADDGLQPPAVERAPRGNRVRAESDEAVALLLARARLSQMDVPTRQAYVVAVVDPAERTAAAAYTNSARYVTRPLGPLLAGVAMRGALGAPFLVAGALKSVYDVGLYVVFRDVQVGPSNDAAAE
jgi:MFS family permease